MVRNGKVVFQEASIRLVYTVRFVVAMSVILSGVEIAYLAFLHAWNSEVFAAITGLIGTATGVLIGRNA